MTDLLSASFLVEPATFSRGRSERRYARDGPSTHSRGDEARIDLGRLGSGQRFAIGMGLSRRVDDRRRSGSTQTTHLDSSRMCGARSRPRRRWIRFRVRLTIDDEVYETEAAAVLIANFGACSTI
jgi:hypothetical protein